MGTGPQFVLQNAHPVDKCLGDRLLRCELLPQKFFAPHEPLVVSGVNGDLQVLQLARARFGRDTCHHGPAPLILNGLRHHRNLQIGTFHTNRSLVLPEVPVQLYE